MNITIIKHPGASAGATEFFLGSGRIPHKQKQKKDEYSQYSSNATYVNMFRHVNNFL